MLPCWRIFCTEAHKIKPHYFCYKIPGRFLYALDTKGPSAPFNRSVEHLEARDISLFFEKQLSVSKRMKVSFFVNQETYML